MAVDVRELFRRGGLDLVHLLEYCVLSVQMDPVFLFLVDDYRSRPTRDGALALHDLFCASDAPAPVAAEGRTPHRNVALGRAIAQIRREAAWLAAGSPEEARPVPMTAPAKYVFDELAARLDLAPVASRFDPGKSPRENLPGGRMTAGQRHFVEKVWQPLVRPRLVRAGFWRIADIG